MPGVLPTKDPANHRLSLKSQVYSKDSKQAITAPGTLGHKTGLKCPYPIPHVCSGLEVISPEVKREGRFDFCPQAAAASCTAFHSDRKSPPKVSCAREGQRPRGMWAVGTVKGKTSVSSPDHFCKWKLPLDRKGFSSFGHSSPLTLIYPDLEYTPTTILRGSGPRTLPHYPS